MVAAISPEEHPRIVWLVTDARGQTVFSLVALCAILLFGSTRYMFRPYDGMYLQAGDGMVQVVSVDAGGPAENAGVMAGDQILSIDGRPVDGWGNTPLYRAGIGSGDVVMVELQRGNQTLALDITMGSFLENTPLLGALAGMQFLSLSFWAIGLSLCIFVPRYDIRARLVGLAWLLGGTAMAAGGLGGGSFFWGAYTTLEVAWCCLGFVLIASHLYFPAASLVEHRKRIINALAVVALLLSALILLNDWLLAPRGSQLPHYLGFDIHNAVHGFFFLSVLASLGLLVRHRFLSQDPDTRRQTGILIWGTVLGFTPFFVLTLLPDLLFGNRAEYVSGTYSVLFLVLVPLTYAYVIHQRKLLRVDFIINRMIVFLVLVLLILAVSILILGVLTLAFGLPKELFPLAGGVLAVFLALPSASLHRTVQQHVNRVLYGCHYDFSTVTSSFSIRLAQTLGQEGLTGLLVRDLTEQMAIQQAALFLSEGNRLVIQRPEVENISVALDDELCRVLLDARVPVRAMHLQGLLSPAALADWRRFDWARLFVPLIFENQLDGLLILGDRTAGDVYSDQDVQIIATIAYQGALAYANVRLVEMLRGLHHQLVRADEAGRKQIARDLHDTVLQQLFFIKQGLFSEHAHTPLIDHIDDVIQTLRQTIRAQRPALLDQGLQFALQDLVEEMQALASPAEISWHSTGTGRLALSDEQTTALYRIAQEALTNSVKHASARTIKVSLQVRPDGSCRLCIEDDGVGMHTSGRGTRSPGHHYGLVGMRERAAMINAKLHISSAPGEGTRIAVEAC